MKSATKDNWVEIENVILTASERAPQVPNDTKKTPLVMWTKGFLIDEHAEIGDIVSVKTLSDRITSGKLVTISPKFGHDFGEPVHELLEIGMEVKKECIGEVNN